MLRLLAALFAALRSLRLAIPFTPCATHSCRTIRCLYTVPERSELSARVLMSIPENAPKGWKQQDLPGSWVTHICICPVLRPRRDRSCQAITASRFCPTFATARAPTVRVLSRLYQTASAIAVYALRPGSHRKVSDLSTYHPPLPGLSWRDAKVLRSNTASEVPNLQ